MRLLSLGAVLLAAVGVNADDTFTLSEIQDQIQSFKEQTLDGTIPAQNETIAARSTQLGCVLAVRPFFPLKPQRSVNGC
jgi:hypothetical protein